MSRLRLLSLVATVVVVAVFVGGRSFRHTTGVASQPVPAVPSTAAMAIAGGGAGESRGDAPATKPVPPATVAGGETQSAAQGVSLESQGAGIDAVRMPQNLGIPEGPFDPVLTQAPPFGRSVPPTNHRANDPAGEDRSIVQSEVTIATHGDTVVVGWNDGIGFVTPGATISGYGYSVNRGATWVDGGSVPDGQNTAVYGDPTVTVTNDGQWVFGSLDEGNPTGLAINRARFHNGTLTWSPAVKYSDGGQFLDKEYLEYDSATNRIYLTYVASAGRLSWSTDGGATWAAPVSVGGGGNGFYPAPGIDGEVYVSWVNPLGTGNGRLYVRYSSNGGSSWAGQAVVVHQLGSQSAQPPQCFNRGFNVTFPSMSIDRSNSSHRGRAYMCWTDGGSGNFDCFLSYSDDKGQTWSSPVRLNDEQNTSEQFWPQVWVGNDGRVSVGWYDRRNATGNNSLCDFYITQSVDGGLSWGPNRRLSDTSVAWCGVPANITPNFGDYIELTSDDRSVYGVWADARGGGPDVWVGRFDDRFLLAVAGTPGGQAPFDAGGTAWYVPNETEFTASPAPALDSQAELAVAAVGLGTLATPPETNGVFQAAGEALHGEVNLSSSLGVVNGTFTAARSGQNGINFTFAATSSGDLNSIAFLPISQIHAVLVPAGPGQVNFFGTATMRRLIGPINFSMGGTIHFDGNPSGVLAANQSVDETMQVTTGTSLTVHTRSTVVDGYTVDVPSVSLGTNPPPLATVRATPNPIESSTKIVFTLTHPSDGVIRIYSVDGRSIRTITKGRFEAGVHEIPFDGRDDAGRRLAKGGYFIRLETDKVRVAGKLFVAR